MIEREEIFAYVEEKFDTEPDYPWFKYPDYAVLRLPEQEVLSY